MKEVAEIVILDIKPYSESSLWVCFFSEKHGLQNGIIKGGKKKKVKPLVLGLYEASFYRWSNSGLQNINGVERSVALENTYNSAVKILIAFFSLTLSNSPPPVPRPLLAMQANHPFD